jgi:Cu+-exporting ATPase
MVETHSHASETDSTPVNHGAVTLNVPITGMTCAACVLHVGKALRSVEGVESADVSLASETANVILAAGTEANADDLLAAVRDAGYGVTTSIERIHVGGMTYASCVNHVGRALRELQGVTRADVNLSTETAEIEFVSGSVGRREIRDAVSGAGYEVVSFEGDRDAETEFEEARARRKADLDSLRLRVIASLVAAAVIMAAMQYGSIGSLKHIDPTAANYVFLLLAAPIQFWAGARFYRGAWGALKHRTTNMNTLVVVGTSTAFFYSAAATLFRPVFEGSVVFDAGGISGHATGTYFDVSTAIIGLILLGRWLEARARGRTSDAIRKLIGLTPSTARVEQDGEIVEMSVEEISTGDLIILRPGERVSVDGTIESGSGEIDESMLTGESVPVEKSAGDMVYAGTVNGTGGIRFRATRVGRETALAQIVMMVERAQASRAPVERLVDRVTAVFVPTVLSVSLVTFIAWLFFAPDPAFVNALLLTVAVLVVACPCALGLATPTAITVGMGRGASSGLLIRNAEVLESAHKLDTVVFDKTGTLTEGRPSVTSVKVIGVPEDELVAIAAAVEAGSEHPVAAAVTGYAKSKTLEIQPVIDFAATAGRGVEGRVGESHVLVGSIGMLSGRGVGVSSLVEFADKMAEAGQTVLAVARDGAAIGLIGVMDTVRPSAVEAVRGLRAMGIRTVMLTGDNRRTAETVAARVGIDEVFAEVMPADKAERIAELQSAGRRVAMVGDGINDAPALALADVGIAIGSGTDVAIESADITLTSSDPRGVAEVIGLSRATMRTVRQNLFWAFFYNVLLIPIAAGALHPFFLDSTVPGWLHPLLGQFGFLNPVAAAAAMALSSVSVVTNSLRLGKAKVVGQSGSPPSAPQTRAAAATI